MVSDSIFNRSSNRQLSLDDRRSLTYVNYGNINGEPIVYCHGFPGSRLEAQVVETAARKNNVSIISVDRPGYGLSAFHPRKSIADTVNDIVQFTDRLGLKSFSVLGISGGGPYALACAAKIPSRVSSVGIVGGLGPVHDSWAIDCMKWPARLSFRLAQRNPQLLRLVYSKVTTKILRKHPQLVQSLLTISAPAVDREVLNRPDIRHIFLSSFQEALRNGPQGAIQDFILYTHDWGFKLEDITTSIKLWYGKSDETVPLAHGEYLATHLQKADARFIPGEGHFSLLVHHTDRIIRTLIARGS